MPDGDQTVFTACTGQSAREARGWPLNHGPMYVGPGQVAVDPYSGQFIVQQMSQVQKELRRLQAENLALRANLAAQKQATEVAQRGQEQWKAAAQRQQTTNHELQADSTRKVATTRRALAHVAAVEQALRNGGVVQLDGSCHTIETAPRAVELMASDIQVLAKGLEQAREEKDAALQELGEVRRDRDQWRVQAEVEADRKLQAERERIAAERDLETVRRERDAARLAHEEVTEQLGNSRGVTKFLSDMIQAAHQHLTDAGENTFGNIQQRVESFVGMVAAARADSADWERRFRDAQNRGNTKTQIIRDAHQVLTEYGAVEGGLFDRVRWLCEQHKTQCENAPVLMEWLESVTAAIVEAEEAMCQAGFGQVGGGLAGRVKAVCAEVLDQRTRQAERAEIQNAIEKAGFRLDHMPLSDQVAHICAAWKSGADDGMELAVRLDAVAAKCKSHLTRLGLKSHAQNVEAVLAELLAVVELVGPESLKVLKTGAKLDFSKPTNWFQETLDRSRELDNIRHLCGEMSGRGRGNTGVGTVQGVQDLVDELKILRADRRGVFDALQTFSLRGESNAHAAARLVREVMGHRETSGKRKMQYEALDRVLTTRRRGDEPYAATVERLIQQAEAQPVRLASCQRHRNEGVFQEAFLIVEAVAGVHVQSGQLYFDYALDPECYRSGEGEENATRIAQAMFAALGQTAGVQVVEWK